MGAMDPTPFYIVTGTRGEYSDTQWWVVSAHLDPAEADRVCKALEEITAEALKEVTRIRDMRKASHQAIADRLYEEWQAGNRTDDAKRDAWIDVGRETQRLVDAYIETLPYKLHEIDARYSVESCTEVPGTQPIGYTR